MPKNLGRYDNDLSVPRKKDIDDLANVVDDKYSASNPPPYPVISVNGQTGAVNLGATDIGAVSTTNVTQTLGTSTTKVPSEKAVSDALSSAGADDMHASVYDPQGKRTDVYKYADNASVYEARLKWGGASISADVAPIDAAMLPSIGNNKAEFSNVDGVSVEYSTDGGATWVDYNASEYQKTRLLSANLGTSLVVGKDAEASLNNKLRITVNANTCGFYTLLKKVLVEINTAGTQGCSVIIERARGNSQDTFETIGTYQISGASGWNSLDVEKGQNFYFGGASSQTSNWWVMRFTFSVGGFGTWGSNKLTVSKLLFLGTTSWIIPSNIAKTGHLYSYDGNQSATFPANVEARGFIGDVSNATAAFSTATTRANIATGEKLSVLFGKIAKWFADLGSLAFKSNVVKSDLSSDVQASLNKADTALQSAPVASVNGQTGAVTLGAGDIGALPLTGGTMSGVIDMNGAKITNVGTPTAAQDAANKAYADSVKGVEVLTQSVEPTTQVTGDFWFQES